MRIGNGFVCQFAFWWVKCSHTVTNVSNKLNTIKLIIPSRNINAFRYLSKSMNFMGYFFFFFFFFLKFRGIFSFYSITFIIIIKLGFRDEVWDLFEISSSFALTYQNFHTIFSVKFSHKTRIYCRNVAHVKKWNGNSTVRLKEMLFWIEIWKKEEEREKWNRIANHFIVVLFPGFSPAKGTITARKGRADSTLTTDKEAHGTDTLSRWSRN